MASIKLVFQVVRRSEKLPMVTAATAKNFKAFAAHHRANNTEKPNEAEVLEAVLEFVMRNDAAFNLGTGAGRPQPADS